MFGIQKPYICKGWEEGWGSSCGRATVALAHTIVGACQHVSDRGTSYCWGSWSSQRISNNKQNASVRWKATPAEILSSSQSPKIKNWPPCFRTLFSKVYFHFPLALPMTNFQKLSLKIEDFLQGFCSSRYAIFTEYTSIISQPIKNKSHLKCKLCISSHTCQWENSWKRRKIQESKTQH